MLNLMKVAAVLTLLENTASVKRKKSILEKHRNNVDLKVFFRLCLDGRHMFHVTPPLKCKLAGSLESIEEYWFDIFSLRKETGSTARKTMEDMFSNLNPEAQEMLRRIFNRDPRCGVAESTINKVWKKWIHVFDVMKGENIEDLHPQLAIGRLAHAKIDGKRCLAIKDKNDVTFISSTGKPMYNMEEAAEEILNIPMDFCVLDGEMFDTNWNDSSSISSSSKTKKTSKTWALRVWDILTKDQWQGKDVKTTYDLREELLDTLFEKKILGARVKKVHSYGIVKSVEHFHELCKQAILDGHEGLMLKLVDYIWTPKRGTDWIKYKPTETLDVKIIRIEKGKAGKKYANVLGKFICVDKNGVEFGVGGGLSDEQRKHFYKIRGQLIDTVIEVKVDLVHPDNKAKMKARFPRFVRQRPDKTM